jgi:hypothetical protein
VKSVITLGLATIGLALLVLNAFVWKTILLGLALMGCFVTVWASSPLFESVCNILLQLFDLSKI